MSTLIDNKVQLSREHARTRGMAIQAFNNTILLKRWIVRIVWVGTIGLVGLVGAMGLLAARVVGLL